MKRLALLPPLAAAVMVSLHAAVVASPQSVDSTVEKQIRAVLESQQDAWNRGDIDAFMSGYDRGNATTFVSEDKITRGWATVRDRYRKKYSDRAKMGKLTFSDLEITQLNNTSAFAVGNWSLKRAEDQPHGRFTLIFRLTNTGWRIVHDHTSAAGPAK